MGRIREFFTGSSPVTTFVTSEEVFEATPVDWDALGGPAFYGLSASNPIAPVARIDRKSAIQVPAVKRTRDLICGTLGGLPLDVIGPDKREVENAFLAQPEKDRPRSVTFTRLAEDLLFEGIGWLRITEFSWTTYPARAKRIDPASVTVNDSGVWVEGKRVPDNELIRFDSPCDPLLAVGARAIRTALALDAAAARYADEPQPLGYFSPSDGADPADDEDVVDILNGWQSARQTRATGYVPAALTYNTTGFNAEQIQLHEQRQHAALEISRLSGIDPEDLGVSTTSRTYANSQDRRKAFLDHVLAPYMHAIEERLSMGDVTPRGYTVRFNLSAFLRSDDLTRMQTYAIAKGVGALTLDEIRELEDRPALTAAQRPEAVEPSVDAAPVAAARLSTEATFEAEGALVFDSPVTASFEVDEERRTIKGLAVPYGLSAMSKGRRFQFSKGVLSYEDVSRVKVLIGHDFNRAVGVVTALEDTDEGLFMSARIAKGAAGDEALSMAAEGVWDGLSIGIGEGGKYRLHEGVHHAVSAPLGEISITPMPSFTSARIHAVAASATEGNNVMTDTIPEVVAAEPADFSALTDAIKEGFSGLAFPQREVVSAGEVVEVNEPLPYRFDGKPAQFSLVDDMRDAQQGNADARQRLEKFGDEFAEATFAVATSNVTTLNPTQNRADLYVPNLSYSRPLWDSVSTGSITDKTPFTVPKFSSASGLVGAHTEGTEPTPGAFAATNMTVTPGAVSGKIEINREVLDAGGSPQADAIIWQEMVNGWYEAIEAKIATTLAAVGTAELNLASAVDSALVNALTNYYAGLQFVRGGNRFTGLVLDGMLFPALINAKDTAGRPLFPVLGPSNANGQVNGAFDRVQIGNQTGRAAWALGATNASKSYSFVPSSVWAWASAPKRFEFQYQVKSVDLAIWGYSAAAVLRDSDVKPIDYTAADA